MLLRFGCENFRSFSTYQEILFTATPRKDDSEGFVFPSNAIRENVLPIIALYGANGSGKTNFLRALSFFKRFICNSAKNDLEGTSIPTFRLNDEQMEGEQTFDIDFITDGLHYHYGFLLLDDEIVEEWLFSYSYVNRSSKTTLFHRDEREDDVYQFGKSLKGQNKNIAKMTSKHSLFLSVAAKLDHELLGVIQKYFLLEYNFRFSIDINEEKIADKIKRFELQDEISEYLSQVQIGSHHLEVNEVEIDDVQLEMRDKLKTALQGMLQSDELEIEGISKKSENKIHLHRKNSKGELVPFSFSEESLGTKALISLLVAILRTLRTGGILIVDEIESSLHTLLTMKLVELFSNVDTNPNQAQLIFSTHETHLLSFHGVRRDQIWFTERCVNGASHIAPLTDYKVPKESNLRNGYINGKFGGIPYLKNFNLSSLFKDNSHGKS